ncbi:MAG: N-glycosylase/DNA lyase [Candidatus Aureabacteria bacterium]|nr:N-glycosylase/DNA lyase [Candidatus Auribacterota bacterium]
MRELLDLYSLRKTAIQQRLSEFRALREKSIDKIFAELCFCLCTPQSKAKASAKAISLLEKGNLLETGTHAQVSRALKKAGVRFHNNKSRFIIAARECFARSFLPPLDSETSYSKISQTRDFLVKNIKGIGYKEASHFLRNIGYGDELAILDVHILKNMARLKIIRSVPKSITKRQYLLMEKKLKAFSKKAGIPLAELDLLLWSKETGEVFK